MASEAAGDGADPWIVALALEQFVRSTIRQVNFSQAFATAADVAENPQGDCTEHAVLLAGLARARGIPARVAIGLVYISAAKGFGYHMWNEVWIDDRWIPLDATLAQGGIGAAHLKLTDSNLKGASAYSSFLPVAQVMGQLKIEVLEVE
jgi:transglutaminase-like putative cysteine protease